MMPDSQQPPSPEIISELIAKEAKNEHKDPISFNTDFPRARYSDEIEYVIKSQFADSLQQNRQERIKYAKWTFWLTVIWILVVLAFVFFSSYRPKGKKILEMSDTILITLITTTTVNVFAFFILVMKFLFNKEELAALGFIFTPLKKQLLEEK
ncbi:MAG: hypothetical protein ABIN97_07155 [Ginsengibacter sp.]